MEDPNKSAGFPPVLMLLIALVQGFALVLLHESIEFEYWPATSASWLYALYAIVLIGPTIYLLAVDSENKWRLAAWVTPFTLLCGLLGFYVGSQVVLISNTGISDLLFSLTFTLALLTFKGLMYIQLYVEKQGLSYPALFNYSWRNMLTLVLAGFFTLVTWGVLMLWAGLFKVINVDFFYDLFTEKWVFYPVLAMALAFGIILIRRLSFIIDAIKRVQQALLKYLLVLLVFVSLIFLAALPFTGLAPLWEDGPGSYLILWMQACLLFSINSVYQGESTERPYHIAIHRFIYLGVTILPIYSALVYYGLSLRIDQYGWSLGRAWGIIVWGLLALFSVGYVIGIVRQRDAWISTLGRVNVAMGMVFMVLLVAVNSPMLDLRKLVVSDQLARLHSDEITVDELDILYFERYLAKPGFDAIEQLRLDYAETHPEFVVKLNRTYQRGEDIDKDQDKLMVLKGVQCLNNCTPPDALLDLIYLDLTKNKWDLRNTSAVYLIETDADEDGQSEFLLLKETTYSTRSTLYVPVGQHWAELSVSQSSNSRVEEDKSLIEKLGDQQVHLQTPRFKQIRIGDMVYNVSLYDNLPDRPINVETATPSEEPTLAPEQTTTDDAQ